MRKSTPAQRMMYHLLKKKLAPTADGLLKRMTGKGSSLMVSRWQLDEVLKELEKIRQSQAAASGTSPEAEIIPMPRAWRK